MAIKTVFLDEDGESLDILLNTDRKIQINLSYRDSSFEFEDDSDVVLFIEMLKNLLDE